MQNEKLKKVLKLGALVSFAAASISIAETSITSSLEASRLKAINASYSTSPINTSYDYRYLKSFQIYQPAVPEDDKLKKIIQLAPQMDFSTLVETNSLPLIYTAKSLDSFLDSVANFQESPEELTFDHVMNNVFAKKNLDSTLIDSYLLKGSAWQESRFFPHVVSNKKAVGYLQIIKKTYLYFNPGHKFPEDAEIPENNISTGIDYYAYLIDYIKNNHPRADTLSNKDIVNLAIVSYNSGPGAFLYTGSGKHRKLKPVNEQWKPEFMPRESQNHLTFVTDKMEEFKKRDKLIEFAKEYQKRKEYIAANDSFYGRN